MADTPIPYCGPAPVPDALWSAWNLDPWLLAVLPAMMLAAASTSRVAAGGAVRTPAGIAGFLLVALAFVSPLCALSSALFSARVAHHLVLVAAAAPLLALAMPAGPRWRRMPLSVLFLVHTVLMWFWHAPRPYEAALSVDLVYWAMEVSLLGSAFLMWQGIFAAGTGRAVSALFGSIVQMGMLGALLTFAGAPLYAPHMTSTIPFALTPLEDQQLAGLLMWVPAALPYLAATLLLVHRAFQRAEPFAPGRAR